MMSETVDPGRSRAVELSPGVAELSLYLSGLQRDSVSSQNVDVDLPHPRAVDQGPGDVERHSLEGFQVFQRS